MAEAPAVETKVAPTPSEAARQVFEKRVNKFGEYTLLAATAVTGGMACLYAIGLGQDINHMFGPAQNVADLLQKTAAHTNYFGELVKAGRAYGAYPGFDVLKSHAYKEIYAAGLAIWGSGTAIIAGWSLGMIRALHSEQK